MRYEHFTTKLIDKKGRLFGLINVADLFFLLFFAFLIVPFISVNTLYVRKIVSADLREQDKRRKEDKEQEKKKKYFLCVISCDCVVEPALEPLIAINDHEVGNNGEIIGTVLKRKQAIPYGMKQRNIGGQNITLKSMNLKQVSVTLQLKVFSNENDIFYKDESLVNKSSLLFSTAEYSLTCKINGEKL